MRVTMEHEHECSIEHVYAGNDRIRVLLEQVREIRKHGESCGGRIRIECERDVDCLEQMIEEQKSEACMYMAGKKK